MNPLFAVGMPGIPEMLIILVVLLVVFGAKRLPELARGLGQSFTEFRKARDEFHHEARPAVRTEEKKPPVVVGKRRSVAVEKA